LSVFAEFQLPSLSGSGLKVYGWGGLAVATMFDPNPSFLELEFGLGFDNKKEIITKRHVS